MENLNIKTAFIRKRCDNYNVVVEYMNEEGKIKQKSLGKYKSKKDAEKHLIKVKNNININKFIIPQDITLVDRCYKYMEDNRDDLSPNTLRNYSQATRHIKAFFDNTKLTDLRIADVQAFVNAMYAKFDSPATAAMQVAFLKALLNDCYRMKEVEEKFFDFIKKSKKKSTFKASSYSVKEAQQILDNIEGLIIEIPVMLMMLCGLRYGEMAGLRWQDIDFEKNELTVNQIYQRTGKEKYFKVPKTPGSIRTIAIPKILMEKLKKEKTKQKKLKIFKGLENEYDLVCLNTLYNPWSEGAIREAFVNFLCRNNIRILRLHDLRHTQASLLLAANVNMKAISKRLGHTDIKITMNTYAHLLEDVDKQSVYQLEDLLEIKC